MVYVRVKSSFTILSFKVLAYSSARILPQRKAWLGHSHPAAADVDFFLFFFFCFALLRARPPSRHDFSSFHQFFNCFRGDRRGLHVGIRHATPQLERPVVRRGHDAPPVRGDSNAADLRRSQIITKVQWDAATHAARVPFQRRHAFAGRHVPHLEHSW